MTFKFGEYLVGGTVKAFLRAGVALGLGLSCAITANAQDLVLEEIIVSARRVDESLLDVPIAISAVSAEMIDDYNFKDFTELQDAVAGFRISEISFRAARSTVDYTFRGIYVPSFFTQSPATLFVDGAPVISGRLASFENAERVELLKGPQAVYFGRSTYTGAINVITKTPSDTWSGRIRGEIASSNSSDVALSIEGPLIQDKLSVRVAAQRLDQGSQYVEHVNNMAVGGRETRSISGSLYAKPSERFSLKLYSEYSVFTDDISAVWGFPTAEFSNCNPAGAGGPAWICGEVPDIDIAISRLGFPAVFDDQFKTQAGAFSIFDEILLKTGDSLFFDNISAHAIADYEFESGITVNAIAAYHKNRSQGLEESTQDTKDGFLPCLIAEGCGRPFGQYLFLVDRAGEDLSLEARIRSSQDERLRWTFGVSYVDFDTTAASQGEINFLSPRQFSGPGETAVKTSAVFGGAYFDVNSDLTISGELRYQVDKLKSTPNLVLDPSTVIPAKFKSVSPRVTIDYKITDAANVYVSWATGTRPGTVNNGLFSLNPLVLDILNGLGATLDVDEEKIEQFELGLKGRFLEGRLQTTMAAYIGTLNNQQIGNTIFVQTPEFTNTIGFINNAGKTDIHGFEIEAQALITDQFTVNGHFGWNASDIKSDRCADCIRLGLPGEASVGNQLSGTPETTGGMAGTYTVPMGDTGDWFGRVEYAYIGSQYATRANLTKTDAANKFNFRAGFRTDTYSIETYLTNAFNDKTPRTIRLHTDLPTFGTALKIQLPERRKWGVRGTYNF